MSFSCTIVPFIRVRKIEEFRPKRCFKRKRERAVMAVTKRYFVIASCFSTVFTSEKIDDVASL